MSPYTSPITELLTLGECHWQEWFDYSRFEFTPSHIPELLQLAQDWKLFEHDDAEMFWAPVHAWRVLGILQAEEAVEPLAALFFKDDEDFVIAEYLPSAVGRIGAAAAEKLWTLAGDTDTDEDARDLAIEALRWNATFHKEDRESTIARFSTLLDDREDDDTYLNTALVGCLMDLKATQAIDTIKSAFARGKVDREINGDLEDIEMELRETRTSIPDWRYDMDQEAMLKDILAAHSAMTLRRVEGFLFAIWGSPQQVPPNRWMKAIFGDNPEFDEQQEKDIYRILFNLFSTLEQKIEMGLDILPDDCLSETPEDERFAHLQEWSRGFGEANSILVNFWEEIFQHPMMQDQEESWTACTILLSVWNSPEQLLEKAKEPNGPNVEKMLSAVPSIARELSTICAGIKTRWNAITEPKEPITVEKIGRNEPCPCGSGKKYKKCCGS